MTCLISNWRHIFQLTFILFKEMKIVHFIKLTTIKSKNLLLMYTTNGSNKAG